MTRRGDPVAAVCAFLAVVPAAAALAGDYVVLSAAGDDADFRAAAAQLAAHHGAEVLELDPAAPARLLPALRKLAPRNVALVMKPAQIELGFQRRFLEMATRVDDDPFVDFAFGYVTGASGAEAQAMVAASIRAGGGPRAAVLGSFAGGAKSSLDAPETYRLRDRTLPVVRAQVAADDDRHDRAFVARFLPKLAASNLIMLSGHGLPDRVVGGLDAADVERVRLDGAVVLDVACWNGVTGRWYRTDRRGTLEEEKVAPDRSMALALLRTGICGLTAYLCPRPQGPELDRDLISLLEGATLGDARRRDYDKTVLGFLGYGEKRMEPARLDVGSSPRSSLSGHEDVMLEDAPGGVLFGDPALRPFTPLAGADPVDVRSERTDTGLVVTATCPRRSLWLHCPDPTASIGEKRAMRVYARLPLGDLRVADVAVESVRVGLRDVASRVVWAVEDDRGERFLQAKVMFPWQESEDVGPRDDLAVRVRVRRASGTDRGRSAGGSGEAPVRTGR